MSLCVLSAAGTLSLSHSILTVDGTLSHYVLTAAGTLVNMWDMHITLMSCWYQVLKGSLGMIAPDVEIDDGKGMIQLLF